VYLILLIYDGVQEANVRVEDAIAFHGWLISSFKN